MKVTVSRLKEIIKEELQKETLSPIDFSTGRDPAVSQTPDMMPSPGTDTESIDPTITNLDALFNSILRSPEKRLSANVELDKIQSMLLASLIAKVNPQE